MKKLLVVLLMVSLMSVAVLAGDLVKMHFYEPWYAHWESAGPIVAKHLGFFEEEGLDVELIEGGPGLNPIMRMKADKTLSVATGYVWVALMIKIEENAPLKVISTDFQDPALRLVTHEPIQEKEDLFGKLVEVWQLYEHPLLCYLGQEHYHWPAYQVITKPGPDKVTVDSQGGSMQRFLDGQVDGSHAMIYNELLTLREAYGFQTMEDYWGVPDQEKPFYVYRFEDLDPELAWPENSLVVDGTELDENPEAFAAFVRAYYRGWLWTLTHPAEEVLAMVLAENANLDPEREMAGGKKINELLVTESTRQHGLGYLDPVSWESIGQRMYKAGLISRPPTAKDLMELYQPIPSGVFPED